MGTDSSKILDDFFSGDRRVQFVGKHHILLPDYLKKAVVLNGIPFEVFLNQADVAEGSRRTLDNVTKRFEDLYKKVLEKITNSGFYPQVSDVRKYYEKLKREGALPHERPKRPDWDAQLRISQIIIDVLKEHEREFTAQGYRGDKKSRDNWDMHEPLRSCIIFSLYYVSIARRFGLKAEAYTIPGHVIVGLAHGNEVHYADPTWNCSHVKREVTVWTTRTKQKFVFDYRNPRKAGYYGLAVVWSNKAYALREVSYTHRDPTFKRAYLLNSINAASRAIALDPGYKNGWSNRGGSFYALTKLERSTDKKRALLEDALTAYCKALDIEGNTLSFDTLEIWAEKGLACYRLASLEEDAVRKDKLRRDAIDAFEKVVRLDEKKDWVWANLGWLLLEEDRIGAAEKYFDRSLELNHESASAWAGKGKIFLQRGIADKALKMIEWALKIDPKISYFWALKGEALEKMGRHEEAQKAKARAK